ncbi:MAG TPA: D-aminoacyl-tRNA deacylase [Syntrophales bacterium]|nr:D-aminoacyl-tRNA deacylase [Syntrophales bacterium]
MRCVVQRVDSAQVTVEGRVVSRIGKGLLVFLGVEKGDGSGDADFLLEKIINLRVFEDTQGKMNLSLIDTSGGMLIISQFTLLADCRKGRRPSFIAAADPENARRLYDYFVVKAGEKVKRVGTGEFQAMMKIDSINDGPVTLLLDSRKQF